MKKAAIMAVQSVDLKVDWKGDLQVKMSDESLVVVTVACWAVNWVALTVYMRDGMMEWIKAAYSADLLADWKGALKVEKSVDLMVALKAAWWAARKADVTAAKMDTKMAAKMVVGLADALADC